MKKSHGPEHLLALTETGTNLLEKKDTFWALNKDTFFRSTPFFFAFKITNLNLKVRGDSISDQDISDLSSNIIKCSICGLDVSQTIEEDISITTDISLS